MSLLGFYNHIIDHPQADEVINIINTTHLHSNYKVGYDTIFTQILEGPIHELNVDDSTFYIYPNGVGRKPAEMSGLIPQKYTIVHGVITGKPNAYKNYMKTLRMGDPYNHNMFRELEAFYKSIKKEPWFK